MSKNKIGRNSPCPCGSGKKFKKCCHSVHVVQCREIIYWLQRWDQDDPPIDYNDLTVEDLNSPDTVRVLQDRKNEVWREFVNRKPPARANEAIVSLATMATL